MHGPTNVKGGNVFNPLKAKLNPICHLLALLGAHPIFHVSRIRVNIHEGYTHIKFPHPLHQHSPELSSVTLKMKATQSCKIQTQTYPTPRIANFIP
jgi:hypothetical protein